MSKKNDTVKVSNSQTTWNAIKDKSIDVFAETKQVSDFCEPVDIDPEKCYLKFKASAVLPALEIAIGKNYTVELAHNFILVEPKSIFPTVKK